MHDQKSSYYYYYLIYIIFLCFGFYYFLKLNLDQFPNKYVFSELLINYQGGFLRKGLLGDIIFQISKLDFDIKKIIFSIQFYPYIIYLTILSFNIFELKKNNFFKLILFSPIFLFYPIAELESLGRKDIYVVLLYLIYLNINIYNKFNFDLIIIFLISVLIHELTLFYIGYYLFALAYIKKKKKLSQFLIFIFFVLFLVILILNSASSANLELMTESLKKFGIGNASGAIAWLDKSIFEQINIVWSKINLTNLVRYTCYTGFILSPFILLHLKNKNNKLILLSFFPFFLSLLIFSVALDWGRFLYINYNFFVITYIFLYKKKLINNCNFHIIENKKIFVFIFIFYCLTLNPKITLEDDIGSFPQIRSITKIIKYF